MEYGVQLSFNIDIRDVTSHISMVSSRQSTWWLEAYGEGNAKKAGSRCKVVRLLLSMCVLCIVFASLRSWASLDLSGIDPRGSCYSEISIDCE